MEIKYKLTVHNGDEKNVEKLQNGLNYIVFFNNPFTGKREMGAAKWEAWSGKGRFRFAPDRFPQSVGSPSLFPGNPHDDYLILGWASVVNDWSSEDEESVNLPNRLCNERKT